MKKRMSWLVGLAVVSVLVVGCGKEKSQESEDLSWE